MPPRENTETTAAFLRLENMKLSELNELNFKTLPTEVLQILKAKVCDELWKRQDIVQKERLTDRRLTESVTFKTQVNKKGNKQKNSVNFKSLMMEDWTNLFSGSSEKKFYVYAHVEPGTQILGFDKSLLPHFQGRPFYIGKGTGSRAFDLKRNQGHGAILSELASHGKKSSEIVQIMKDGLTEPEALALEAKLIYFFGTRYERLRDGILVNLDIPKTPY